MEECPKKMRLSSSTVDRAPAVVSLMKANKPGINNIDDSLSEEVVMMKVDNQSGNNTNNNNIGRERLKRHREDVAGRVLVPESWGKEDLMKDWIEYSSFDKLLAPKGLRSAREALITEAQRQRIIETRCR